MGNSATYRFNLKMMIDGKEQVGELTGDLAQLRRALSDVKGNMRIDAQAHNLAAAGLCIEQMQSALQGLRGAMQDLQGAYAVQQEAETKLETVMRQRMDATDSQIQGIKDLASEQQKLGVIGDEVQLMGAQQLSTFLTQERALRTLIPAMNDLVAQQKGLGATAGDAVSVANLMGKAMQGNASALTRVGITMTEAQKSALEMGTEMERAAMLAEIITDNVGHMNAELAKTSSGRHKQLANALGDVKERLGQLAGKAAPMVELASSTTMAALGVVKLVKGVKSLAIAQKLWNSTAKIGNTGATKLIARFGGVGVSATAASVGVRALSTAIRGLLCATVVGIALAALTLVVEKLMEACSNAAGKTNGLADAQQHLKEMAEDEANAHRNAERARAEAMVKMQGYITKIENFNGTRADEKKLINELNETYGDSLGYFSTLSQWLNALTQDSSAYCQQLANQIELEEIARRIADYSTKSKDIKANSDAGKYSTKRQVRTRTVERPYNPYQQETQYDYVQEPIIGSSENEKKLAEAEAYEDKIEELKARAAEINATTVKIPVVGSPHPIETPTTKSDIRQEAVPELDIEKLDTLEKTAAAIEYLTKLQRAQGVEEARATQTQLEGVRAREAKFKALIGITKDEAEAVEDLSNVETESEAPKLALEKLETLRDMEAALSYLRQLQRSQSVDEARATQQQIEAIEGKIASTEKLIGIEKEEAKAIGGTLRSAYDGTKSLIGAVEDLCDAFDGEGTVLERVIKGIDALIAGITALNAITQAVTAVTSIFTAVKSTQEVATAAATAAAVGETAEAAAEIPVKAVEIAVNKELAASLLEVAAAATFAAHAAIPFAGTAIAAAAVVTQKALTVAAGAIPFAEGGLVYGPTLALMGEYGGASRNPEVVAPLDKLRDLIGAGGGVEGEVVFKIGDDALVGVLKRRNKRHRRLGNG